MSLETIKTEWDELSKEFANLEVSEIEIEQSKKEQTKKCTEIELYQSNIVKLQLNFFIV